MMDRWLSNNTVVKVISFLVAIMLWAVVNNEPASYSTGVGQAQASTQLNKELKIRYDEKKFLVDAPSTVHVEIRGSKDLLAMSSLLSPDNFEVFIDLRGYESGRYEVPVQYEGLPHGLDITIQPSQVSVNIEEIKKIQKNVQVHLMGKARGYTKAGEPVIKPQTVTVAVPESRVKDVAFVQAVVSVEEAEGPIDTKVPLRVLDRKGQPLDVARVSPSSAEVYVPLVALPSKMVPLRVQTKGVPANGYKIDSVTVTPPQITIYGSQSVLDTMSSYTLPEVDVSGWTATKKIQVNVPLLDKIEKTDIKTAEVTVNISKAEEEVVGSKEPDSPVGQPEQPINVHESVELPIRVQGLASDKTFEFVKPSSGRIRLELQGTKESMEKFDRSKLTASVDISDNTPGEHTMTVRIANLPPDVKVTNPGSLQVTILIKEQAGDQHVNS
ncbi:CdaR family protein [Aneurinibacillus thermoaerophilus]|uniref:CdaR family protein n=1 Tax=Aneurinibacillus thermoaerophilus TaxID=143495 RepID=UPI002E22D753|nr:CdaR family protein [Aneurinibacillus thermoaerophilus]MED0766235.1 CdaR family protein [Aneurinibacillus thermoaerophilus]